MSSRDRGAVLIFTIWATAALATVGILQATRLSLQSRYSVRIQDEDQARYLAESGVELAGKVLSDEEPVWDSLADSWARPPSEPLTLGPGTFRYQIQDEQARLPLNRLSQEQLLLLPGFSASSAAALWARRAEGKRISHPAELKTLPGFQADSLPELLPLVTVHGSGPVNLNTAPLPVLRALGFSDSFAAAVSGFRNGADGQPGTPDDGVFKDREEVARKLLDPATPLLNPGDAQLLSGFLQGENPMLGVASNFFRVAGEGRVTRTAVTARVTAVVDRNGAIGGWHED